MKENNERSTKGCKESVHRDEAKVTEASRTYPTELNSDLHTTTQNSMENLLMNSRSRARSESVFAERYMGKFSPMISVQIQGEHLIVLLLSKGEGLILKKALIPSKEVSVKTDFQEDLLFLQ